MILEKNNLQTAQEWAKSYFELTAPYVHQKTGNYLESHLRAIMAFDHLWLFRPGKKIRPNFFAFNNFTLHKILPTNLAACKQTFYTIYTSHLRWNSAMRHCFYHTDLGQNAVFHNFVIKIALIQYSGRSKHAWILTNPLKNFPKSPIHVVPAGSHFCSASSGECLNEH